MSPWWCDLGAAHPLCRARARGLSGLGASGQPEHPGRVRGTSPSRALSHGGRASGMAAPDSEGRECANLMNEQISLVKFRVRAENKLSTGHGPSWHGKRAPGRPPLPAAQAVTVCSPRVMGWLSVRVGRTTPGPGPPGRPDGGCKHLSDSIFGCVRWFKALCIFYFLLRHRENEDSTDDL